MDTKIGEKEIKGLLFADKFGEVWFFNYEGIGKAVEEIKEETAAD